MLPGSNVCVQTCPTGFTLNDITKECDGTPQEVFCLEFDNYIQIDWVDGVNGLSVTGEAADNLGIPYPLPAINRGVFFDGRVYFLIDGF